MKKLSFLVVFLLVFSPFLAAGDSPSRVHGVYQHSINMPPKSVYSPKKSPKKPRSNSKREKKQQLRYNALERTWEYASPKARYRWNALARKWELAE